MLMPPMCWNAMRGLLIRFLRSLRQYTALFLFIAINAAVSLILPVYYEHMAREIESPKKHVTIEELLARKNYTTVNLLEEPKRKAKPGEESAFLYLRVDCPRLVDVNGFHNRFQICDVNNLRSGHFHGTAAYFVGGVRDALFEKNFHLATDGQFKVKVFPTANKGAESNQRNSTAHPPYAKPYYIHSVEYYDIGPFTMDGREGLKDIVDERDDTRRLEFMKLDMGERTEAILFSIYTGIDFCNVLLRAKFASFNDLRYLVARMNFAIYYVYAVKHDAKTGVYYISFMKRFCRVKYGIDMEPRVATWRRENFNGGSMGRGI